MPPTSTVTAAALLAGLVVLLGARSWRCALRVLLDLLMAAGLLRLSVGQGWREIAEAAAIVVLRTALWRALAAGTPPSGPGNRVDSCAPRCAEDDHVLR